MSSVSAATAEYSSGADKSGSREHVQKSGNLRNRAFGEATIAERQQVKPSWPDGRSPDVKQLLNVRRCACGRDEMKILAVVGKRRVSAAGRRRRKFQIDWRQVPFQPIANLEVCYPPGLCRRREESKRKNKRKKCECDFPHRSSGSESRLKDYSTVECSETGEVLPVPGPSRQLLVAYPWAISGGQPGCGCGRSQPGG